MSLYQKYRSKSFSEIITQDHVTKTLQSSLKSSSFGHAYLFVGTRGTGKTSIARIFARAINCQNEEHTKKHGEPCNECTSCSLAISGANIDIIEMDAASNRGIEEVRNLKEAVDFLPSIGKYKVYIIDEAHMMTKEAFNALLKTIEEPPKHIVFILCTTEVFKLPATIISRSQVFEMKQASIEDIVNKINIILESERVDLDEESKRIIAKLGKGSFRDTESILEKVITTVSSSADVKVTPDLLVELLGMSSLFLVDKVKKSLYKRDTKALINILEQEIDEGVILGFNSQLAESIYMDIIQDLDKNNEDKIKFGLFDFLSTIEKDLRNTLNPKVVYIAKLLNFTQSQKVEYDVRKKTEQMPSEYRREGAEVEIDENKNNVQGNNGGQSIAIHIEEVALRQVNPNNPSALLRQKRLQDVEALTADVTLKASKAPQKKKFISKLDFLNFLQDKNNFLYRFFSHHEFQIEEDRLVIQVQRQMEKDLLTKPQTINLIKIFGTEYGIELKIDFGNVKVDKRTKEEKGIVEHKKRVEELSEDEIKDVFSNKSN